MVVTAMPWSVTQIGDLVYYVCDSTHNIAYNPLTSKKKNLNFFLFVIFFFQCGRAFDPNFLFLWPNARVSVLAPGHASGLVQDEEEAMHINEQ